MNRFDLVRFWLLRHSFWVVTGVTIATLATVILLVWSHLLKLSQAVPAIATLFGFYIASLTLLHQQVRASVDEYNRLNAEFNGHEVRRLRALVASSSRDPKNEFDNWEDLFDFFEDVAFKSRLGIIELPVAYQMFSYWILNYWFLLEDRLTRRRKISPEDQDLYSELEWLTRIFALLNPSARNGVEWWHLSRVEMALNNLRVLTIASRERFLKEEEALAEDKNARKS